MSLDPESSNEYGCYDFHTSDPPSRSMSREHVCDALCPVPEVTMEPFVSLGLVVPIQSIEVLTTGSLRLQLTAEHLDADGNLTWISPRKATYVRALIYTTTQAEPAVNIAMQPVFARRGDKVTVECPGIAIQRMAMR